MDRQQGNVLFALPQQGQVNGDHIQAIIEIVPELGGFHPAPQIPVGGGQDPDIRLDVLLAPHPFKTMVLLRFLQDHCFERVGGEKHIEADVRVLAATNRDLRRRVETAQFRDDLYYRLNVISIHLPLLRERKEDIPLLAVHFLKKYNLKEGKHVVTFGADAMEALLEYDWPGNVRQLENAVSHALILAQGDVIRRRHLPRFLRESAATSVTTSLAESERHLILRVLQESNWNKHEDRKS